MVPDFEAVLDRIQSRWAQSNNKTLPKHPQIRAMVNIRCRCVDNSYNSALRL